MLILVVSFGCAGNDTTNNQVSTVSDTLVTSTVGSPTSPPLPSEVPMSEKKSQEQDTQKTIDLAETDTYSPMFDRSFDFELATGVRINKRDVLTGRPVFMLSVSEN